jgi:hypothetical protein
LNVCNWIIVLVLLLTQRADASVLSDAANALAPGQWVQIATNGINVLKKSNGGDIAEFSNKGAYDPASKKVLFCGASHHGNFITDCVAYDLASNTWSSIGLPAGLSAGPDNGSAAESWVHGYDFNAIDQTRGIFYMRRIDKIHRYSIAAGSWLTPLTMPSDYWNGVMGGLEFSPEIDRLVFFNIAAGTGHIYNPNTNTWSSINSYPGFAGSNAHAFFFRSNLGHIYTGAGNGFDQKFHRYNANHTITALANMPVAGSVIYANVIADPVSGKPLLFSINTNLYVYDPASNTWSNTGAGSKLAADTDSSFITPINDHGVIMLVKAGLNYSPPQVWLYRHGSGSDTRVSSPPPPSDTTVPSTPTNLAASGTSSSQINLSWSASSDNVGVVGYRLERCSGSSCTNFVEITDPSTISYSDTGLSAATTHRYRLRAFDAAGNLSAYSAIASATTQNALPVTSSRSQLPIPSLQDERNTYKSWGWTWNPAAENPYPSAGAYSVSIDDIHGDLEADDLWTNLMQYRRRGDAGFLTRATAWATYYKNTYTTQFGGNSENGFGGDHIFGWGLIDWYLYTCNTSTCDTTALTKAQTIGAQLEDYWGYGALAGTYSYGCLQSTACTGAGLRRPARHLILAARLAEVTGLSRWATLRDLIFTGLTNVTENPPTVNGGWNNTYKMWFYSPSDTDSTMGVAGEYAAGTRIVSTFQVGIMAEAFWQYYRTTGSATARQRIIDMAGFVFTYGMDPVNLYSCDIIGVRRGAPYCRYLTGVSPAGFVDPNYTISLVNILVMRYKLTGETAYLEKAKVFFNRGTKGVYTTSAFPRRETSDTTVGHFQDTMCGLSLQTCTESAYPTFFFHNKGELQYTYLIFENGGFPTVETVSQVGQVPAAPSALSLK